FEHDHFPRPCNQTTETEAQRSRLFNTSAKSLPLPPRDPSLRREEQVRPSMLSRPSYLSITTGDEAEDELEEATNNRAYPSFPTYSSSYKHLHFPSSESNATYVPPAPDPSWRFVRQSKPLGPSPNI